MSFKFQKGILPLFLKTRQCKKRKICNGSSVAGAPIVVGLYENSDSVVIVDTSGKDLESATVPIFENAHVLRAASDSVGAGYWCFGSSDSVGVIFLGNGTIKQFKMYGQFFFFMTKTNFIAVDERNITKVPLRADLTSVFEYPFNASGGIDSVTFLKGPKVVVNQCPVTNNIAVTSNHAWQVWDFSKSSSRPDGTVAAARFVGGGITEAAFGIAILRIYADIVCAITHSGDVLEIWHLGAEASESLSHVQIRQSVMATSLHVDFEKIIVGHADGTVSLYDRISGVRMSVSNENTRSPRDRGLLSAAKIMWVDRLGDLVFSASSRGFSVRKIDQLGTSFNQPLPLGTKLEQISLDKSSGIVYATVVSGSGDDSDASVDFITWSPPLKELSKRNRESSLSVTELAEFDLSPPASLLSNKAVKEWSCHEVVTFIWSLKLGEVLARTFYDAGISGADLVNLDEERLKDLGVAAFGHRRRILSEIARRQTGVHSSPVLSRSTTPTKIIGTPSGTSTPKRSSSSRSIKAQGTSEQNLTDSATASSSTSSSEAEQELRTHRRSTRKGSIVSLDSADRPKSKSDRNLGSKMRPSRSNKNITVSDRTADIVSAVVPESRKIKFCCKVINSDHSIVVRVNSRNSVQLKDLREDILDVLLAQQIVDSPQPIELFESATGVLEPLDDQKQLDSIMDLAKCQNVSSITLYLAVGSEMSSKCWDEEMTIVDAKQTIEASEFCCTLVEPDSTRTFPTSEQTQAVCRWARVLTGIPNAGIVAMNKCAEDQFGYKYAEIQGKSFDSIIPIASPDFLVAVQTQRLLRGGEDSPSLSKRHQWNAVLQTKTGQLGSFKVTATKVHVDGNLLLHIRADKLNT